MDPDSPSKEVPQEVKKEAVDTVPADERCTWIPRILEEEPGLLALRERSLNWTGGLSFANLVHTAYTSSPVVFNRHAILELIYNHFLSIGMDRTAEILAYETGHKFQIYDEPWDRTGLLILISLGVLPREDPWNIPQPENYKFIEEPLEEDFFASHYRENPQEIYKELLNPELYIEYDAPDERTFRHVKLCTLKMLIVLMTGEIITVKDDDLYSFFLTLHSMTSSEHYLTHLITLYDLDFGDETAASLVREKYPNLRLSVANNILKWINFHGLFIGHKTLKLIEQFAHRIIESGENDSCTPIFKKIIENIPKLRYGQLITDSKPKESPIIKDPQVLLSPSLTILDADPREVARQISLLSHRAFAAVHSREFLVALSKRECTLQTPTLSEFMAFGDKLERAAAEAVILSEDRQGAVRRLVEISGELLTLMDLDAVSRILAAVGRPELQGLVRDAQLADTIAKQLARCGEAGESAARSLYANRLSGHFLEGKPAVPNMLAEMRLAPPEVAEPDFVGGRVNWRKRHGLGEKALTLYGFQNRPYAFWDVPQIQKLFLRGATLDDKVFHARLAEIYRATFHA